MLCHMYDIDPDIDTVCLWLWFSEGSKWGTL